MKKLVILYIVSVIITMEAYSTSSLNRVIYIHNKTNKLITPAFMTNLHYKNRLVKRKQCWNLTYITQGKIGSVELYDESKRMSDPTPPVSVELEDIGYSVLHTLSPKEADHNFFTFSDNLTIESIQ